MDINEFSSGFDVLYNQVNSNQASSLDEYEKSIFLTKSLEEIVIMTYSRKGNKFIEGIDDSQNRQYDFSTLIRNRVLTRIVNGYNPYDPRALSYVTPNDMFLVLNESIVVPNENNDSDVYQVIPIAYNDYSRLMKKPYKYPPKNSVWRIITSMETVGDTTQLNVVLNDIDDRSTGRLKSVVEIIGKLPKSGNFEYRMRYIKRPLPIILTDLSELGLSINGINHVSQCELPEGVHQQILQRAVELATAVYNPLALGNMVGVGNVSSTNIGVVQSNDKQ